MSTEQFYRFLYLVVWPFFNLFHPVRTVGREHIPEGGGGDLPQPYRPQRPVFCGFRLSEKEPSAGDGQDPADAGARDRLAAGQGGHLRSGPGPCGHARGQDGSALPERGAQAAHLPRGDPRGGGGERGRQGGSGHVCHPDGGAHRPHVHPGAEALVPPYHCGDRRALLSPDPGAAGHGGGKSGDRP